MHLNSFAFQSWINLSLQNCFILLLKVLEHMIFAQILPSLSD